MGNTLLHDLHDHAKDKQAVAAALAIVFATMLNPKGWQILRGGTGNNSWRMYHPVTHDVWFFTGYTKNTVNARNDYFWARAEHHPLKTRLQVVEFARLVLSRTP